MKKIIYFALLVGALFYLYTLINGMLEKGETVDAVVENLLSDGKATEQPAVFPDDTLHLTFKGVPLNGSLRRCVKALQEKGFELVQKQDTYAQMVGEFAGYTDCVLYAYTLERMPVVYQMGVVFDVRDEWSELYGDYKHLKSMLTQKYGKPKKCVERFVNTPSYVNLRDDNTKMREVGENHCEYYAVFAEPKGEITLTIDDVSYKTGCVRLFYRDKLNSDKAHQAAMDDL